MKSLMGGILTRNTPVRRFTVSAAISLALFTVLVFAGIFWRTVTLIEDAAREQATSYIDLIVDARAWNAGYDGVWVLKSPGVESNPYLKRLGIESDTSTVSGHVLTLRNPSVMTREMSQITEAGRAVRFKLTSLQPINPDNAPDAWERSVLERFKTDRTETSTIERGARGRVLRMMRPLIVEDRCLDCHATQGYKVGDIRGGLSLELSLAVTDRSIRDDGIVLFGIFGGVVLVGGLIGYRLVTRMARRIDESEENLQTLATTDALTGIANRRAILMRLEQEVARATRAEYPVGIAEFDVDHFKLVNDRYGHAAGDAVLKQITARVADVLRAYDTVGRLGGEEFLIIAPDIDADALSALAERVRATVSSSPVRFAGHEISVAVSVGATLSRVDDSAESVMVRADTAMYAAKDAGRNMVRIA